MKREDIQVKLSPAQKKFVKSKSTIIALIGPQGEGKTYAGFWGMIVHATKFKNKIMRGAIIRDTFENIKNMTIPSILDSSFGEATFHDGGKKMRSFNAQIDLFGIDDLASLTKLQGAEYTFVWLEEPAPIIDTPTAGLREEVFDTALSRITRQKGAIPRLQITMNPASEDHWTYHRLFEDPHNDEFVQTEIINIPYGENRHITTPQREVVKRAFKDRPDLYKRYVEGKFSFVMTGEAVTPEYKEDYHYSQKVLYPMPNIEVFRFWDGGLNPACVFCQITPSGKLHFLDTMQGENMGVRQLIQSKVKPLILRRYSQIKEWRDIGDPSMANREQSDSSQSAAEIINEELNTTFELGEMDWQARRESVKEMLTRDLCLISKNDGILHRCFRGGWHYRKDASGKVLRDKPVKDMYSHPGDAVSHGLARILGVKKVSMMKERVKLHNLRMHGLPQFNPPRITIGRKSTMGGMLERIKQHNIKQHG